jgi:hypothetical protein
MNQVTIEEINSHIQQKLREENLTEVRAVDAAIWLDDANLLKDSKSRPGQPLRKLLRLGVIIGSHQEANGRWYICRNE